MRAPISFNTSLLISTWVSVACHAAVILTGFWLHATAVRRITPPTPALDEGENAVTVVWRSPRPREPLQTPVPPAPEEPPRPEALETTDDLPAESAQPQPPTDDEDAVDSTELEPTMETASTEQVVPGPVPPTEAEPERPTPPPPAPPRATAPPPRSAPRAFEARVVLTRLEPSPPTETVPARLETVDEEPPSEGKPGVRHAARLTSRIAPRYPRSCRRRGHEGTVRLECRLDAGGEVVSVNVAASAGCEKLDRAALEAIRSARFAPARLDDQPVAGSIVLPVEFRLRDS